jgi:hypothetical protein
MKLNQTLRQFVLLGAISRAASAGLKKRNQTKDHSMKKLRFISAVVSLAVLSQAALQPCFGAPWAGSDDFSSGISPANWTIVQESQGQMTVVGTNGHASFLDSTSTTTAEQNAYIIWNGTPTAADDWTADITGHNSAPFGDGGSMLQFAVVDTRSLASSVVGYRIALRQNSTGPNFNVVQWTADGLDPTRATIGTTTTDCGLRLVYHSASKQIEACYDPTASGLDWTTLDTISLAKFSPTMTASSTFTFAILSDTDYAPLTEGEIWADNFQITNAAALLSQTLTVTINGRGSVSPTYKGKTLKIGKSYTIKATHAPGFAFSDWIETTPTNTVTSTDPTLTFTMEPNLQLTANFVDIQPPTMAITTKKSAGSNSVVLISGTAKDNVGVSNVWWQVGSNGWNLASTGNACTNWTAYVILSEGQNTIQVYAEDAAGNRSKTNSLTLNDVSLGLVAPECLAGTMLELAASNSSAVLGFYGSSFSQMGSGKAVSGVGLYTYTLSDSNMAQLATTFTAPPMTVSNSGGGEVFTLSFTNGTSGTWSNLYTNSGTFTLSDASSTAPDSLSGLTLADAGTNVYQFTNEYGDWTFTAKDTNGNSAGTYTFAPYSPMAGLLLESLTNAADLGTTNYVVLSFLTGSNSYYGESDTTNGAFTNGGTFSVSGEPSTEAYTAPVSLAGLTGAGTEAYEGMSASVMHSFGASTYGDFSSGANELGKEVSTVGTYTYIRTGPKTAVYQNIGLEPPEEAATNSPVLLVFTSSHSAKITTATGRTHGTITFSEPASTVPLSLVGRKCAGKSPEPGRTGGVSFGYGTFTGIEDLTGVEGTYTYTPYGPKVAMVILSFTVGNGSGTTPGTTWYWELWFTSATSGSYNNNDFTPDGILSSRTTGTFTMK